MKIQIILSLLVSMVSLSAQVLTIEETKADIVRFTGATNVDYSLQVATDLANPVWHNLSFIDRTIDGVHSYTNIHTGPSLFYRTANPIYSFLALDASSPAMVSVPVTDMVNGQYLDLPILVFDLEAVNVDQVVRGIKVKIPSMSRDNNGTVGAAYLYNGSTLVESASVVNGVASFQNITSGTLGSFVHANTTIPFIVKVDVTGVTSGSLQLSASVNSADVDVAGDGNPAWVIGSVAGNAVTVVGKGAVFELTGTPTIARQIVSPPGSTDTIMSVTATFNVSVMAVGEDVTFGLPTAVSQSFTADPSMAVVYKNGTPDSAGQYNLVVGYNQPLNTVLSSDGTQFTVAMNQITAIPVNYTFLVKNPGSSVYSLQLEAIRWMDNRGATMTSFGNDPRWRTSSIQ